MMNNLTRGDPARGGPGPEDTQPAIRVRDLRVVRGGREVIPGLTLEVPTGQVVGLLGPSGCGKTTLLRSIVGVQIVASGTIEVLGQAAGNPALRERVAYVTQTASVYPDLTVHENLAYFAAVLMIPRLRVPEAVQAALAAVDLADRGQDRVARLSGGELSRVSLAVALMGEPQVLVLDEPTVGLDPVLRRDLWDLFHRLAAAGATLLVSSHVMDEAGRCDRLLLMREGALLADDTPDGILRETGTDDIESAFLRLVDAAQLDPEETDR
ncbi:MAG: type transport system ATP-binding protein [Actinomycetota bacterium]|nr:type transport system ATP-binding protein [Actinomycetota bacterium]